MFSKPTKDTGHCLNDGIPTSRKGQIGITQLLFQSQFPSLVFGCIQSTEKVFTRILLCRFKHLLAVPLHKGTFALPVPFLKNMYTPANPGFRFLRIDIEQVGQGMGLERNGKVLYDLKTLLRQHLDNQFFQQDIQLLLHLRQQRPTKERLNNLAILRVLRWIRLNRILTNRTYTFL